MKKILLSLALLSVVLSGCRKEQLPDQTKGEMSISLTSEGEFTPVTKVDASDAVDINDFGITITNKATGAKVLSWEKLSAVPAVIAMDPASYTIKATSPGVKDVAWNQPVYEGSQDFVIEGGKVVNIDLICTLRNMKVTVKCSENFTNEINDDFTIKVSTVNGYLEFTKAIIDQGTAMAGFFSVAPIAVDIKGTRRTDGSVVSHYFTVTNVAAKDHHVITVDAKETGLAQVGANGINVSYEVNNKPTDILLDSLVENPVEDDLTGTPVFQNASIAANATEVDTTVGSITLNYSLPIELADNANITLGSVAVTPSCSGKVLTLSFGKLAAATSYTLNIPAGAVVNSTDQSPAAAYTLSFTTKAKAVAVPITIEATAGIGSVAVYPKGATTFNVSITAEKGIEDLYFDVNSPNAGGLESLLTSVGMSKKVNLANMSEAEAAFWGDILGFEVDDVDFAKGRTNVSFSIGTFFGLMPAGSHNFVVSVKDADGNEKTEQINITITE